MRTNQLEYFVVAARTLSFTDAARECGVAQPAISQQIRRLEEELGFELFARSQHGLELTDAGRAYLLEAIEALRHLQAGRENAANVAHGLTGKLTIGTSGETQGSDLAVLHDFHEAAPDVSLAFREIMTKHQGAQLRQGEYDTLYSDVCQFARAEGVRFTAARTLDLCVMVNRKHPLAREEYVTPAMLNRQTLLFAEPSDLIGSNSVLDQFKESIDCDVLFADTQNNAKLMLRLNMGIALAPESVATSVSDDLVILPMRGRWPKITLAWVSLEANENPALATFLAFAERKAQERERGAGERSGKRLGFWRRQA